MTTPVEALRLIRPLADLLPNAPKGEEAWQLMATTLSKFELSTIQSGVAAYALNPTQFFSWQTLLDHVWQAAYTKAGYEDADTAWRTVLLKVSRDDKELSLPARLAVDKIGWQTIADNPPATHETKFKSLYKEELRKCLIT